MLRALGYRTKVHFLGDRRGRFGRDLHGRTRTGPLRAAVTVRTVTATPFGRKMYFGAKFHHSRNEALRLDESDARRHRPSLSRAVELSVTGRDSPGLHSSSVPTTCVRLRPTLDRLLHSELLAHAADHAKAARSQSVSRCSKPRSFGAQCSAAPFLPSVSTRPAP